MAHPPLINLSEIEYVVREDYTYSDDGVEVPCWGVWRRALAHSSSIAFYNSEFEARRVATFLGTQRWCEVRR